MNIRIDHYVHFSPFDAGAAARIESLLHQVLNQGRVIMNTLADVQAAVASESTVVDSAVALITGLIAQIAALQPNQAAIDQLVTDVTAKRDALAAAVAAGTPAAPGP